MINEGSSMFKIFFYNTNLEIANPESLISHRLSTIIIASILQLCNRC